LAILEWVTSGKEGKSVMEHIK